MEMEIEKAAMDGGANGDSPVDLVFQETYEVQNLNEGTTLGPPSRYNRPDENLV